MKDLKEKSMKKVDYAIALLKNDLRYEVRSVFALRHKIHPTMTDGLLEICHEIRNAISLLQSENTEGVSNAQAESSDLHVVRQCNANDKTDESSSAVVDEPLGKITETKKVCYCEFPMPATNGLNRCSRCERPIVV